MRTATPAEIMRDAIHRHNGTSLPGIRPARLAILSIIQTYRPITAADDARTYAAFTRRYGLHRPGGCGMIDALRVAVETRDVLAALTAARRLGWADVAALIHDRQWQAVAARVDLRAAQPLA